LAAAPAVRGQQNPDGQLPVATMEDPFLLLLRDPWVESELKITADQHNRLRDFGDSVDPELWKSRNQPIAAQGAMLRGLTQRAEVAARATLRKDQLQRLEQIRVGARGIASLEMPQVIRQLKLNQDQGERLTGILSDARTRLKQFAGEAGEKATEDTRAGQDAAVGPLNEETLAKIRETLSADQWQAWIAMMGSPVKASLLGHIDFLAPAELPAERWINSAPLSMEQLRGRVVALHFFAFGCVNCIHNYPAYRRWEHEFREQPFVLIGIHTPETANERDFEQLKVNARDEELRFPIVMDDQSATWNAWGNSMWPSVYLIDKQGRVRFWWLGELNWNGAEGEEKLTRRIQQLLEETP
jgi:peroxiredoxin